MTLPLLAKLITTLGCAALLFGVWTDRMTVAWIGWLVAFLGAEGLGVLLRGTLSGHVWTLYVLSATGGALALTLLGWLCWHLALEHFAWPHMVRAWWDDVAIASLLFVGARAFLRARNNERPSGPPN